MIRSLARTAAARLDAWAGSSHATSPARPAGNTSAGWRNSLSGLGFAALDKGASTDFGSVRQIREREATDIYEGDGMAARVVDLPIFDALREGWLVEGDGEAVENDAELESFFADLPIERWEVGLEQGIERWLRYGAIYGGSALALLTDEADTASPMAVVEPLRAIRVLSRWEIEPASFDLSLDPINGRDDALWRVTGTSRVFHRTRLIMLGRSTLPRSASGGRGDGWDVSAYCRLWASLSANGTLDALAPSLLHQFVTPVQKIRGLAGLIAEHGDAVMERLGMQQAMRSAFRVTAIDADGEDYDLRAMPLTGLPELMDRFPERVSAVSGIPLTLLMGRSPGGLNATGESDFQGYYDMVSGRIQEAKIRPALGRLIPMALAALGRPSAPWALSFPPLFQLSEHELADLDLKRAQADAIYLDRGVVDAESVAQRRFGESAPMTPLASMT